MRIHVLVLALLAHSAALPQAPRPRTKTSATPVGVLIGWVAHQDLPADDSARSAAVSAHSALTTTGEIALADGSKFVHINETEQADPMSTLWVFVSDGKVRTRRVQHIIIPRRDGFWRLGMNTDSATIDGRIVNQSGSFDWRRFAEEDFFWVTPLEKRPTLGALYPQDVKCIGESTKRELTYVGPDYLGFSAFGEAGCVHYDESSWLTFESIAYLYAADPMNRLGRRDPIVNVEDIALLGPRALVEHGRLAHAARRWASDCGVAGFEGLTTEWTIRRRRGRWEAVAMFSGSGGGVCGRYNEERSLHTPLPRAVVSPERPLPVAWAAIRRLVRDATDATVSPDGRVVIVLSPTGLIVTTVEGRALRALSAPMELPIGAPVMLEWARGPDATRWDGTVSALPVWP